MPNKLTDILPELEAIQDHNLRKLVQTVWEDAMEIGGWTIEILEHTPNSFVPDDEGVSFPQHTSTISRLCMAVEEVLRDAHGDLYDINRDILIAGALLVDIGKLIEFRWADGEIRQAEHYQHLRHPFTGYGLCFKHNVPEPVLHVVASHSLEGDIFERRPESIIFRHAELTDYELSQLGS